MVATILSLEYLPKGYLAIVPLGPMMRKLGREVGESSRGCIFLHGV